jgi:hypothetical protein
MLYLNLIVFPAIFKNFLLKVFAYFNFKFSIFCIELFIKNLDEDTLLTMVLVSSKDKGS